jgi:hypothetical protein
VVTFALMSKAGGHVALPRVDAQSPDWRVPFFAILVAIIAFIPVVISHIFDVLYIFLVVPALILVGVCVLVYAAVRKNVSIAVSVVTFFAAFALLVTYDIKRPAAIRSEIRWLLWAREYKAELVPEQSSKSGEFKHIEWDAWGWLPAGDTTVYLVFDPTDSLAAAAREHRSGKFDGIPCKVPQVNRLESHWYAVLFYTDDSWGQCR